MADPKLDHSRPFTTTVVSARRSGTHLLIEYIRRNFTANPCKSHQFPEFLPHSMPFIHVVRNPWDTLWATYRWFSTDKCGNQLIAEKLSKFSFEEWVMGVAGPAFGYRDLMVEDRDSLRISRGMFYDPIAYWAAHTEAWLALQLKGSLLSVKYEQLVRDPEAAMAAVSAYLKEPMTGPSVVLVRTGVGHAPEHNPIGYSAPHWTPAMRERLSTSIGSLLDATGYSDDDVPGFTVSSAGNATGG